MATQLGLYNSALSLIGERGLNPSTGLSENAPSRFVLDDVYTGPPTLANRCLSKGLWRFAQRTQALTASGSSTPSAGYTYAFDAPSDFIRTIGVWTDTTRSVPLRDYVVEGAVFSANITPFVIAYVSNGASYGGNLAAWPADFADYAAAVLARRACPRIKAGKLEDLQKEEARALADALSHSAMEGPKQRPPVGSWVRGRLGAGRDDGRATGWSSS